MREIKFRGYSKAFGMMFTNDMLEMATASMVDICKKELKKIDPQATEIQMGLFLPTYDEDLILMQYTGLKDKNGVEIYEGDILNDYSELGKVIFDEGCFRVCWQGIIEDLFENCNNYEVVGNIYENSTLLEEINE